ncbi:transcription factor ORG2-like [Tripterygium wilfordii]|uniref:transcription factor ORG2-like n=1 Tax=Tripterygium wilfordii TaxID=458696 RepID=UPI0018F83A1D|nr:transcription factor ORG2-like [Tripterygium wilfordii]
MLDLSPLVSTYGWPLEELQNHEDVSYNNNNRDIESTPESLIDHLPLPLPLPHQPPLELLDAFTSSYANTAAEPNKVIIKKLNHNASERDRRKKVNCLYSFLRSLLPGEDQMKKLSIPGTVSRALKYIPELQQQVERLVKKREELWSIQQDYAIHNQESQVIRRPKKLALSSPSTVSAKRVSDAAVAVQITNSTMLHGQDSSLSHILHGLEQDDGLLLISANSFVSSGGIIFYNLHLQVERSYNLESEVLSKKILSLQEKREYLFS